MKWLIESSRYLVLVGIVGLLVGVVASLYFGAEKAVDVVRITFLHAESTNTVLYVVFEMLDSFLVATALLVIAISLYELFIGGLEVPDWMLVKNLDELKAKFGAVLIPVIAVKFVQKLLQSESALDILYYGIAVTLVAAVLTVFNLVTEKEKQAELARHPEENETRAEDLEQ